MCQDSNKTAIRQSVCDEFVIKYDQAGHYMQSVTVANIINLLQCAYTEIQLKQKLISTSHTRNLVRVIVFFLLIGNSEIPPKIITSCLGTAI